MCGGILTMELSIKCHICRRSVLESQWKKHLAKHLRYHKALSKRGRKGQHKQSKGNLAQSRKPESYEKYINSQQWRNRRARFLKKHGLKCCICGNFGVIHVHHLTYERLGNERDSDLQVVCEQCHNGIHGGVHPNSQEYSHLQACASGC
jgi:hypothetical protein